jgi:hypothetical protein
MASQEEERRTHVEGFVDAFVDPVKRERYRSFLSSPKRRFRITNRLNHHVHSDLMVRLIVETPPRYSPHQLAYLISDHRELDDSFLEAEKAVESLQSAHFGSVASIIPGVPIAVKPEAPAALVWLYRPKR